MFDVENTRENLWREANPRVDAMLTAMRPDGRQLSPGARLYPRVAAALDAAQITPTVIPTEEVLAQIGITYEHSNFPDRKPQKFGKAKVKPADASDREFFSAAVEAATTGPIGLRTVVVHDASAFKWAPPELEDYVPALVAWPVPAGYTTARVGRAVVALARCCHWCRGWFAALGDALAVSCGAVTHLFPACVGCRMDLNRERGETGYEGRELLDWITNDGWDAATGYPADRWR
ncbi:hypothetical protein LRS71_05940 [Rhodococcus pyridinivorans]|uniref:hypothetical protein n=1 Tax=Rhodococcus pyridinivorans TaxID=103816 RepID=UPI001E403333|nr:hypothetical protein [Rhodococcus pyridinivorans]MCD5419102.1 hypothetical protein [Rhodococcus pyridinivorans]